MNNKQSLLVELPDEIFECMMEYLYDCQIIDISQTCTMFYQRLTPWIHETLSILAPSVQPMLICRCRRSIIVSSSPNSRCRYCEKRLCVPTIPLQTKGSTLHHDSFMQVCQVRALQEILDKKSYLLDSYGNMVCFDRLSAIELNKYQDVFPSRCMQHATRLSQACLEEYIGIFFHWDLEDFLRTNLTHIDFKRGILDAFTSRLITQTPLFREAKLFKCLEHFVDFASFLQKIQKFPLTHSYRQICESLFQRYMVSITLFIQRDRMRSWNIEHF